MTQDVMMKLVPLHDKLLIRPRKRTYTTKSGLTIPATSKVYERPEEGFVVAVNQGTPNPENKTEMIPSGFQEGEIVFFTRHVGLWIEIEGEKLMILNEDQVIGKLSLDKLSEEEINEYRHGPSEDTGTSLPSDGSGPESSGSELHVPPADSPEVPTGEIHDVEERGKETGSSPNAASSVRKGKKRSDN